MMIFGLLSVKVNLIVFTQSLRLFFISIRYIKTGKHLGNIFTKPWTYGVDYSDTFSLVAKLTFVCLFISLDASYD